MNKEFTVQNFKSASSNASDYLKGKGYDVPRGVMLNMLSVFLGAKNWNTLEAQLSEINSVKNVEPVQDKLQGLITVISNNKDDYIKYINRVLLSSIVEKNKKVLKILHYQSTKEISICLKGHPDSFARKVWGKDKCYEVSYYQASQSSPYDSLQSISRYSMRRVPDVICIADLDSDVVLNASILDMAMSGHLVILGLQADNEIEAKRQIHNAVLEDESVKKDDISNYLSFPLEKIINLNK